MVSAAAAEARIQALRRTRRANWRRLCLESSVVKDANITLLPALEAVSESRRAFVISQLYLLTISRKRGT
jgi:hypothetical protein